uniref:uncharacterized protein n=1 Tax=Myxine glutinosa TaxID=7769 RepID=UPI00358F65F3
MGTSVCKITLPADPGEGKHRLLVNITSSPLHNLTHLQLAWRGENGTNTIPGLLTCMSTHLVAPHGTMFVCGNKAYPYLPDNWGGTCYLGSVFPEMELRQHLHGITTPIRTRRSTYWNDDDTTTLHGADWEKGVSFFFPWAGTLMNSYRIDKIALIFERVANDTATAHDKMLDTVVHMRTMVMQNRVVLDMLLAERGGVCGIIKGKCCTYIPDPSKGVSAAIIRLRESAHRLTEDRMDREASHQWLTDWFKGWTGTIVKWILTALAIVLGIVICGVLIKALVLVYVRKWFSGWTTKETPEKAMVLKVNLTVDPNEPLAVNITADCGSWNYDLNESVGGDDVISASEDCPSDIDFDNFDYENDITDDDSDDIVDHSRKSPSDAYVSMRALSPYVSRAHSGSIVTDPTLDFDPTPDPTATQGLGVKEPDIEDTLGSDSEDSSMDDDVDSDNFDFNSKEVSLPPLDRNALFYGKKPMPSDADVVVYSPEHQHVRGLMDMDID